MRGLRVVSGLVVVVVCLAVVGLVGGCKTGEPVEMMDEIDVADAAETVSQAPEREFCTYRVVSARGPDCGAFATGALICVDCPSDGSCPGAAGGRSGYRYLDGEGEVRCSGEWSKRFDPADPNACLDCPVPPGNRGFEFVGR